MTTEHVINQNNSTLTTTAETAIATIVMPAMNEPVGDGTYISGLVVGTTGAGTTGLQIRVRQDSITGTNISLSGNATIPASASTFVVIPFAGLDVTLLRSDRIYVVTVQQVAATGNGTGFSCLVGASPCTPLVG